jgi:rubrerythrin
MNWNEVTDKLLKRECSAVETYQQALRNGRQESGRNTELQELITILRDHQQAASRLEAQIQQPERSAAKNFGGWCTWSKVVMGAANIFGDRMVLRALKAGEESGFKRYQEVLQTPAIPEKLKPLFLDMLAKQQAHIRIVDGLISKAEFSPSR